MLQGHADATGSETSRALLAPDDEGLASAFVLCRPRSATASTPRDATAATTATKGS